MHLPVNPPVLPMLAKRIDALPAGQTWIFEPKCDGFRALIFRDRNEILIHQSRDAKSLNRYFPELLEPLNAQLPARCVLDGEIVVAKNGGLDFEELQLRIHPAASRVKLLSQQSPASIVIFDLLCEGNRDLRSEPLTRWSRSPTEVITIGTQCLTVPNFVPQLGHKRHQSVANMRARSSDEPSIEARSWRGFDDYHLLWSRTTKEAPLWRIPQFVISRSSVRIRQVG